MNRRSFLQSMSAAFAASVMGVTYQSSQSAPAIRYELFTDQHSRRFDLSTPFEYRDLVCATDQRVLLTHPGGGSLENGDRRVPDVSRLCWDEFDGPGWKRLGSPVLSPGESLCPVCFGFGRVGTDLTPCECEKVEFDDFGEQKFPCPDCDGSEWKGGRKCHACNGDSWTKTGVEVIGGGEFCQGLMARLRTLGDLDVRHIYFRKQAGSIPEGDLLLFRGADGIRGIAMGLHKP